MIGRPRTDEAETAETAEVSGDGGRTGTQDGLRRDAITWLLIFLPVFAVYFATATFNIDQLSPDPVAAALSAHSIASDGDLTIDAVPVENPWIVEAQGRQVSNRQPGVIAFGVPFYAVARNADFSVVPAGAAGAFSAAAFVATLFFLFRELVPRRTALIGSLVAGFATSTWSVSADSLWTHGPDQLFLVVAMLFVSRRSWASAGLAFALAIVTRTHLAVIPLVVGLWMGWRARSLGPVLAIGATSALGLLAAVAYTRHVFGVWDVSGGYSAFGSYPITRLAGTTATSSFGMNILGSLVSLQRGVFVISPFLLLLMPGLRRAIRVAPSWVNVSAVAGLVYFAVQLRINLFDGGARFWGYRLALEPLVMLAPLLLLSYREWTVLKPFRQRLLAALIALSVGYQLIGAVFFTAPRAPMRPWIDNWISLVLTSGENASRARMVAVATVLVTLAAFFLRPTPDDPSGVAGRAS